MRGVDALVQVSQWPVRTVAVTVLGLDDAPDAGTVRELGRTGPDDHPFRLASVSKLLSAYAVLIAVEEGAIGLADPAGPESSTVAHLLAHASGLAFEGDKVLAAPGTRRIYSNAGFDRLAEVVTRATGIAFADYLAEAVFEPLGMRRASLTGSAAAGVTATLADLRSFAAELLAPTLLSAATSAAATSVAFPGLAGVLPGFGRQDPNDWGLGYEIRGSKNPHWTGRTNAPTTFGHFGQAGTFLWVDPVARLACVTLCDRDFGDWARRVWPPLSDDVLAQARPQMVNPSA
ncbi:penicillin-binding protein, beta-lactamase class C [Frankia torreyi]|uniref:Penicillin-binding protein, beta-lactamase class C n=2 Tax=Frankia TaxID=1854 RepID=A0A0D8BJF1_9ACTN|nr:penicillin-binding protein, beta-lactamase class C [Frankia torreyi]